MKRGTFISLLVLIICATTVSAEVLTLNLNGAEFSQGSVIKAFGYLMDNSLNGISNNNTYLYIDDIYNQTIITGSDGYYEYSIIGLSAGNHTVLVNTTASSRTLTCVVYEQTALPSYKIIASSLTVPYRNPSLNVTIKKYLGSILTNDSIALNVFYENGTLYDTVAGVSNSSTELSFPQAVGMYPVVVDNKKSFVVAVSRFTMKFKVTDIAGNPKDTFRPNGIAYFEVEGFSNGQRITNATVTATVKTPSGNQKTVTFAGTSGKYNGNTNVTASGIPISLVSGEYNVEFKMKDSSNNEQKVKGFFKVVGLGVDVDLINKVPYEEGENASFNIVVRDLSDNSLVNHSDVSYTVEIQKEGYLLDSSNVTITANSNPSFTSKLVYEIPSGIEDGDYFISVKANSDGKAGKGQEYLLVQNVNFFVDIKDNFGGWRDFFQPGELAKIEAQPSNEITSLTVKIYNKAGVIQGTYTSNTSEVTFNVPQIQTEYVAKVFANISGTVFEQQRWFSVQNYFSFLDIKNSERQHQFTIPGDSGFFTDINVFDVSKGAGVDLTNFVVKFDQVINEETQVSYTNINSAENTTLSNRAAGQIVFWIQPLSLPNGFYRIEYTLVDSKGKSFKGKGWFGVSSFQVNVQTYSGEGMQKTRFAPGKNINVTVNIGAGNGTATIHHFLISEETFNIVDGIGSVLLSSAEGDLPAEPGWYGFGIEVIKDNNDTGLGDGFFEIKSLDFKSFNVGENGEYGSDDNITVTVTMEKSGVLVNETNITLERLFRARDHYEIGASSTAELTNNNGRTTLTIDPTSSLEPGEYFADMRAEKDGEFTFAGFGFRVTEDSVLITIDDDDNQFATTENIDINVQVLAQNGTAQAGVVVNLVGLLNFQTWAPVVTAKQATTSSNGIATLTISAANYNPGRYAPIVNVTGVVGSIVGFGDGEFEIRAFDANVFWVDGQESFAIEEDLFVNISVIGTVTVDATVKDMNSNVQEIDSYYSDGLLTINNDLNPGEYFLDVTVTSGSNSKTWRLWFEVQAPWADTSQDNNVYSDEGTLDFNYTIYTHGAGGWQLANATIVMTTIDNMWTTDEPINVNESIAANETGQATLDLGPLNLNRGDYILNLEISENPDYESSLYFRVEDGVIFYTDVEVTGNDVTFTVNTEGFSVNKNFTFVGYDNFKNWEYTEVDSTNSNGEFSINDLANGFYRAQFQINDEGQTYWTDAHFDIRVTQVDISAPGSANVGENVDFDITCDIATNFWIIDPFTQQVLLKTAINSNTQESYTFNYPGRFMYGYGQEKWDVFELGQEIEIIQVGFNVQWPMRWRYVVGDEMNFNVSSPLTNTPVNLIVKSHFTGDKTTYSLGNTSLTPGTPTQFAYTVNVMGPQELMLELNTGSDGKPRSMYFIDAFQSQYDVRLWTNRWEYRAGDTVNLNVEVFDIMSDIRSAADDIIVHRFDSPFGAQIGTPLVWSEGEYQATIATNNSWVTGNYHLELNVTKGEETTTRMQDFFVRGNDNLELNWWQNQWDFSGAGIFEVHITARDAGSPVNDVPVRLGNFEMRPENWNSSPTSIPLPVDSYWLSTDDNATDSRGEAVFYINLSNVTLASGGYNGQLIIGSQVAWFDFNVRTYQVDSFTNEWEYGLTDTVELNIRARNFDTGYPIDENGNVTIRQIYMHSNDNWQPQNVSLLGLGITNATYQITSGEALIEMGANNSILNMTKPYEFELVMDIKLPSGNETGWAWFRLSNDVKPSLSLVDNLGSEPESIFPGQNYTLQLTGPDGMSATLRNMWGPWSQNYNKNFADSNGTLTTDFITPNQPGWYTLEVEVDRGQGYRDWMNMDFQIGSGCELDSWMEGNIVPGINFSVNLHLQGEGPDPWCQDWDPWCQERTWFGPLGNKTILLSSIKNLETFTATDLTALNLTATTQEFSSMMMGPSAPCDQGEEQCTPRDECAYNFGQFDHSEGCYDVWEYCSWIDDGEVCNASNKCVYNSTSENCTAIYQEEEDEEQGFVNPGAATFNINPEELNMAAGTKYALTFTYEDETQSTEEKIVVMVESYHVAVSRKRDNVAASSLQEVWLKTQDLSGNTIPNCNITFTGIYSRKDNSLIKRLYINGTTNSTGEMEFTYTAPGMPGDYIVEGKGVCNISDELITQDLAYEIEIGARQLKVDMKTKYSDDENIKIAITTKDRNGDPKSQRMEVMMFHDNDDYPQPIYSIGGSGCTVLDAGTYNNWNFNGSRREFETDETGTLEIQLCPMPTGNFEIEIHPMDNFMMMKSDGPMDDFGFRSMFSVGTIDFDVMSDLRYSIGDEVNLSFLITDEFGELQNGTIVALEAELESFQQKGPEDEGSFVMLYEMEGNISVVNGTAEANFTIPSTYYNEISEETLDVTPAPVLIYALFQDSEGVIHTLDTMQFVVVGSINSTITAPTTVMADTLIRVNVSSDNNDRYKAWVGMFFFQDNPESGKDWMIENGAFFKDMSTYSETSFKIHAPKEPGNYYIGIPVLPLSATMTEGEDPMSQATEILIAPIEVKLDTINATGKVVTQAGNPVSGALVKIGKSEKFTDAQGLFTMEIPKGKKSVTVERKVTNWVKQYIKSKDNINFDSNVELNLTVYDIFLSGNLTQTLYNITTPGFDLSQTKLRINVTVINNGDKALWNASLRGMARSGDEFTRVAVDATNQTGEFLSRLYAGFEDGDFQLKVKFETDANTIYDPEGLILVNGNNANSTIGCILTKEYRVDTYATAGDGFDNDGDGAIDEEEDDNKDNDGDGKIDEDLVGVDYFEFCGNGFCAAEEFNSGNCFIDCATGSVCGDGNCEDDEIYNCANDCGQEGETCFLPNSCTDDGQWCNSWGMKEPGPQCQISCNDENCWACSIAECESKGCSIETDQWTNNEVCSRIENCSDDMCGACHEENECDATSCQWKNDTWSGGGWCERPWNCQSECNACGTESTCINSVATMDGSGCRWENDPYGGGWCVWNMSFGPPPVGGAGMIGNIWLASVNTTEDFNSIADWKGFSGNSGSNVSEGNYFIIMNLGTTNYNITVDGEEVLVVNNMNGYWQNFATSSAFTFVNGTVYDIEVRDLVGPDYVNWSVGIGMEVNNSSPPQGGDIDCSAFDMGECNQETDCYWDSTECLDHYCFDYVESGTCNGNENCTWDVDECVPDEEESPDCTSIGTEQECVPADDCGWGGNEIEDCQPCGQMDTEFFCNDFNGCSWTGICEGTIEPTCGDNAVDSPEVCDGSNLNNKDCTSEQFIGAFSGGTLACNAQCDGFVTTGCTAVGGPDLSALDIVSAESGASRNETHLEITFGVANLSSYCDNSIFNFVEWVSWDAAIDSIPGEGTTLLSDFNGGEDYLLRALNNHSTIEEKMYNYDSGGFLSNSSLEFNAIADCENDNVIITVPLSIISVAPCEPINITLNTVYHNTSEEPIFDTSRILLTVNCSEVICGDNTAEGDEVCDGTDLNEKTCTSPQFNGDYSGGTLACAGNCESFIQTGCTEVVQEAGDVFVIANSTNVVNMHEPLLDVVAFIDKNDLQVLLQDDSFTDESHNDIYNYNQTILMLDDTVKFGNPDAEFGENPSLYLDQTSGAAYTLYIEFDTPVNTTALNGFEEIDILNRQFLFDDLIEQGYPNLLLQSFDTLQNLTLDIPYEYEGEGGNITIEIVGVNVANESLIFDVEGSMYNVQEGDRFTNNGINYILQRAYFGSDPSPTGSGYLAIDTKLMNITADGNLNDVVYNESTVYGLYAQVGGGIEAMTDLTFRIAPEDFDEDQYKYLQPGENLSVEPWDCFGMTFEDIIPDLMDMSERTKVSLVRNSADYWLNFTNLEGKDYFFPVFTGGDTLVRHADYHGGFSANITDDKYFILDNDNVSEIYQLTSVIADNSVLYANVKDIYDGSSASYAVGEEIAETGYAISQLFSGDVDWMLLNNSAWNVVHTKYGGTIGIYNGTGSWDISFTAYGEEDTSFDINLSANISGNDIGIKNLVIDSSWDTEADVSGNVEYGISNYGAYYERELSNSGEYVDLYYPANQMYFNITFGDVCGGPE